MNNSKYLKPNFRLYIHTYNKFSVDDLRNELDNINNENFNEYIVKFNEYKKSIENFKTTEINLNILESKLFKHDKQELFKQLDNLHIDIKSFLQFLLNCKSDNFNNFIKSNKGKSVSKTIESELINSLKGKENDILAFIKDFLTQNKEFNYIVDSRSKYLNKESRIEIVYKAVKLFENLITIFNKEKINEITCNGYTVIELNEFYREINELMIDLNSVLLERVRFKLKELILVENPIISEELRTKMFKLYFEIWNLKVNIIVDELNSIRFKYNLGDINLFDEKVVFVKKYHVAKFIEIVKGNQVIKYSKNNCYISTDKDLINEAVLCPFFYAKGSKHRSNYIQPVKGKKVYVNNETGEIKQLNKVPDELKAEYTKKYADDIYLTISCDTEIDWGFNVCKDYKTLEDSRPLSRPEWLECIDLNLEWLRIQSKKYETDKSIDLNDFPYKIYAKSEIVTIQCLLSDEKTKEEEIYILVDESKKDHYNHDTLIHTYEHYNTDITKTAKIIYHNDIIDYYFNLIINWFKSKHHDIDSRFLKCNVFFHNIKFDGLAIGLIDNFKKFNFTLDSFSTTSPVFFNFDCNFGIVNRKDKEIKSKLIFLDSMNFSPTSLKNLGKSIGIKKETEKVDFNWNNNLTVNKEFLEYSMMDVVILNEYIKALKNEALEDGNFTSYGAAGLSFKGYRSSYYANEIDENRTVKSKQFTYYDENKNIISIDEYKKIKDKTKKSKTFKWIDKHPEIKIHRHKNRELEKLAFLAYVGGRTECFRTIKKWMKVVSIDVNSSYPSSMYQKLPYEYYKTLKNPDKETVKKILDSDSYYSIGYIYVKESKTRILPVKRGGMICYDNIFNSHLAIHEPELKKELSLNTDNIVIDELHIYYATDKLFKSFVDKGMFNKSYYKIIDKNDIKVNYNKLTRNSCYGKFGEKFKYSETGEIDDHLKEFYKLLLSIKYDILFTNEMLDRYIGYVDLPLVDELYFNSIISNSNFKDSFQVDYMYYYQEISNLFDDDTKRLRINLFNNYYSFTKKIERPGDNASPELAGAITSYSRIALYNAMEIIGFDRIIYTDTDSIYFELKGSETIEDIKKMFFNEMDLSLDELKTKFQNMDTYLEFMKEIEGKWQPDKINTSKGLVSKCYLWEIEHKQPFVMLTRGNKDNVKCKWIHESEILIYDKYDIYEIKSNLTENHQYIISRNLYNLFKSNKAIYKNKSLLVRFNEKMKGISQRATQIDDNCYMNMQWLSMNTNSNLFQSYSNQYVIPMVKFLEGRDNYLKSKITKKSKKSFSYGYMVIVKDTDDYEDLINKKSESLINEIKDIKTVEYTEQILKPFEVSNINSHYKYTDNSGFIEVDNLKLKDFIIKPVKVETIIVNDEKQKMIDKARKKLEKRKNKRV